MTGMYIFFLGLGAPLLLWFAFSGDADGDVDADVSTGSLAAIPLSTVAFVMSFFGLAGVVGGSTGASAAFVFVLAVVIALVAGTLNSVAFGWLRRNSTSSEVTDRELEGTIADVILPISSQHRGKIILAVAGAREQMTAAPVDGSEITIGSRVVVVRVEQGVALVAPFDTELELE